jgi:hypothetical protein
LLGKNQQLAVRNFKILAGSDWRCAVSPCYFRLGSHQFDPDRNALLQLNLSNRNRSVRAIEHSLDQTALCITRTISKLWHRSGILIRKFKNTTFDFQTLARSVQVDPLLSIL